MEARLAMGHSSEKVGPNVVFDVMPRVGAPVQVGRGGAAQRSSETVEARVRSAAGFPTKTFLIGDAAPVAAAQQGQKLSFH
jgi:hypothetical protein